MKDSYFYLTIIILFTVLLLYSDNIECYKNTREYYDNKTTSKNIDKKDSLISQLQPETKKSDNKDNQKYQPYLTDTKTSQEEISLDKLLAGIAAENEATSKTQDVIKGKNDGSIPSSSSSSDTNNSAVAATTANANANATETAKKTGKSKVLSLLKDLSAKAGLSAQPNGVGLTPDELAKIKETDYTIIGNITKLFIASQSSRNPFNKFGPALSIDDNLTTYSSTNTIVGYPSWIQYISSEIIEFKQIVISSRIGSYTIKKQLVPFNLTIYYNDVLMGTQRFVEVQDSYNWKSINLIGNKVKITQELIANLEIANVMIKGRIAQADCEKYAKKAPGLYTSCKKTLELKPTTSAAANASDVDLNPYLGLTPEEIILAKEFEKILEKEEISERAKAEKAEKLWKLISAQIKKEADTARQAGKLGMKAPPPMYTQKQIDTVKKYLPKKKVKLSGIDKANCMRSFNQFNTLNNQAIIAGRESQLLPSRQDDAKKYTQEADEVMANYKKMCITRTA